MSKGKAMFYSEVDHLSYIGTPFVQNVVTAGFHYANMPLQYTVIFKGCKSDILDEEQNLFCFCTNHILCVHVRTASIGWFERMSTIYVLERK